MLLLQVAISVWLLQDENNQNIMNMVAGVGQPLYDDHAETNTTLRSCDKAAEWLVDSAKGGFMEDCFRIVDSGHDTQLLQRCGFMVNRWEWRNAEPEDEHLENEHAELFHNFQVQLTRQRLMRGMRLVLAWPEKMQRTQGATPDEVTAVGLHARCCIAQGAV